VYVGGDLRRKTFGYTGPSHLPRGPFLELLELEEVEFPSLLGTAEEVSGL
jgi:hypothetical protein